jgi:hypothetical protein
MLLAKEYCVISAVNIDRTEGKQYPMPREY